MKKFLSASLAALTVVLAVSFLFPADAKAMTMKERFNNHVYYGTWEVTSDPCEPWNVGNTGTITFQSLKLMTDGKLRTGKNKVWFDSGSMVTRGKIYRKNGKFRVNFLYPKKSNTSGFEGHITGTITQNRIKGKYTHSYEGCTWKGTIRAPRQYN